MDRFKRHVVALLFLAVAMFAAVPSGWSQFPYPVPPPPPMPPAPVDLGVPLVQQQTPEWCWLAVAEMSIRYRRLGNSPSQCQMMEAGYRLPPGTCCPQVMNCVRAANGMGELAAAIQRFGGIATQYSPPGDPAALYNTLRMGIPVLAQLRTSIASSHVVVIRGMRFDLLRTSPYSVQLVPILFVNDPLGHFPQMVPYDNFAPYWMDALLLGN